jgi:hypothetical protein
VAVRVVLNGNDPLQTPLESDVNASNRMAWEYLRAHDIDAYFGDVAGPLHAKAMIIDSSTVILGSTNWSDAAFKKNTEASALIQSREFARAALAELGAIKALAIRDNDTVAARVPVKFLSDTALLGRMVTARSEQLLDMYMYLLRQSYLLPADSTLVLDYDPLIHYLGMDSLELKRSRGYINEDLKKLQDRYKLLRLKTHQGEDAEVRLEQMAGEYVAVPSGYFIWHWQRQLDLPGKVMELLSLYYSSISPNRPGWSVGIENLGKRHGVSQAFVWMGTMELRRKNLLDVEHFPLPQDGKDLPRRPNVYLPLSLYDPAALATAWKSLESKYGREETDRARKYAVTVFKDSDPAAVEQLMNLEKEFGTDRMEKASKVILRMKADNPKRTFGYFIGIVKNPGPIGE